MGLLSQCRKSSRVLHELESLNLVPLFEEVAAYEDTDNLLNILHSLRLILDWLWVGDVAKI
jgi:hypothetical protein